MSELYLFTCRMCKEERSTYYEEAQIDTHICEDCANAILKLIERKQLWQ